MADVMAHVRRRLAERGLAPGERLPSIRRLAATLRVSPSTVVEAYDRLAAEGLVRSRPGSGFFAVACAPAAPSDAELADPDRAVDLLWISRQALDTGPDVAKPGCGWLPAEWMPQAAIRRALRGLSRREGAVLTDYAPVRGSPDLRRLLARRLDGEGIEAGPDRILLAGSGSQALDLVCRLVLRPGDTVIVDDPCYFNFQALLRVHGATVVGVPYGPTGPDVALFAAALAAHAPRLYLTNSAIHNPTGATLSPATAHRVLNACAAHDVIVVEDDVFADFEPEPSPRLAALDGLSRVIRIGSFSKTLSASARCGYVAASAERIEALVDLQVATRFGGASPISAAIVAAVLGDGSYRRHVETVRRRLAKARRETASGLEALGIRPWLAPRGGFYLWCRLPEGADGVATARAALRDGLVLAPGDVFSVSRSAPDFMRFNVAQTSGPASFAAIGRALAAAAPAREAA